MTTRSVRRANVYIDGFNRYRGILKGQRGCKWLDLWALAARMCLTYTIGRARYFTARVTSPRHDPGMSQRQFLLGEVELAAFAAMREVEIRVREATDAPSPPQEEPPTEE